MDRDDLRLQKQKMRGLMRQQVRSAYAALPQAAFDARDQFLKSVTLSPSSRLAITIAQKDELDPMLLGLALLKAGHGLCLPVVTGKKRPLVFRAWYPGDPLASGSFGIPEPLPGASPVTPNVILVPLLAFDRQGNRLGRGGGFYDRTLAALREQTSVLAIGFGFSTQEMPLVPTSSSDTRLDAIVTEKEVIWPISDFTFHERPCNI